MLVKAKAYKSLIETYKSNEQLKLTSLNRLFQNLITEIGLNKSVES